MESQSFVTQRQEALLDLIEDDRLLAAVSWLASRFRVQPDEEIGPPLDTSIVKDELYDTSIPDWPFAAEGESCEAALDRFEEAGLIEPTALGRYRQTDLGRWILPGLPLYHQRKVEAFAERFPDFASSLRGKRVLDAGCGVGAYSVHLSALGARSVVALELSEQRVRSAQVLGGAAGPGLHYVRGSVESLPLGDGSVDLVFSRVVLPYVRQERTVQEFARVLAADGRVFLVLQAPAFYFRFVRRLGAGAKGLRSCLSGLMGLAGGAAFELLGREIHWRLRSQSFHLSYQRRGSFQRVAERHGLRLDEWHEDHGKPITWLTKPG